MKRKSERRSIYVHKKRAVKEEDIRKSSERA